MGNGDQVNLIKTLEKDLLIESISRVMKQEGNVLSLRAEAFKSLAEYSKSEGTDIVKKGLTLVTGGASEVAFSVSNTIGSGVMSVYNYFIKSDASFEGLKQLHKKLEDSYLETKNKIEDTVKKGIYRADEGVFVEFDKLLSDKIALEGNESIKSGLQIIRTNRFEKGNAYFDEIFAETNTEIERRLSAIAKLISEKGHLNSELSENIKVALNNQTQEVQDALIESDGSIDFLSTYFKDRYYPSLLLESIQHKNNSGALDTSDFSVTVSQVKESSKDSIKSVLKTKMPDGQNVLYHLMTDHFGKLNNAQMGIVLHDLFDGNSDTFREVMLDNHGIDNNSDILHFIYSNNDLNGDAPEAYKQYFEYFIMPALSYGTDIDLSQQKDGRSLLTKIMENGTGSLKEELESMYFLDPSYDLGHMNYFTEEPTYSADWDNETSKQFEKVHMPMGMVINAFDTEWSVLLNDTLSVLGDKGDHDKSKLLIKDLTDAGYIDDKINIDYRRVNLSLENLSEILSGYQRNIRNTEQELSKQESFSETLKGVGNVELRDGLFPDNNKQFTYLMANIRTQLDDINQNDIDMMSDLVILNTSINGNIRERIDNLEQIQSFFRSVKGNGFDINIDNNSITEGIINRKIFGFMGSVNARIGPNSINVLDSRNNVKSELLIEMCESLVYQETMNKMMGYEDPIDVDYLTKKVKGVIDEKISFIEHLAESDPYHWDGAGLPVINHKIDNNKLKAILSNVIDTQRNQLQNKVNVYFGTDNGTEIILGNNSSIQLDDAFNFNNIANKLPEKVDKPRSKILSGLMQQQAQDLMQKDDLDKIP